jgi:uncharacterized protein (DUF4415 family)
MAYATRATQSAVHSVNVMPRPRVVHPPELYRAGDRVVLLESAFAGETGRVVGQPRSGDAVQVALPSGRTVTRRVEQLRNLTLPARLAHDRARQRRAERGAEHQPRKSTSVRLDADVYEALQEAAARGAIQGRDDFVNEALRAALARLGTEEDAQIELRVRLSARALGNALGTGLPEGEREIGALILAVQGSRDAF